MIGIAYYADDPHKRIFNRLMLAANEHPSLLDDPVWIARVKSQGVPENNTRRIIYEKISFSDLATWPIGTPWTPASEPFPPPKQFYVAAPELVEAVFDMVWVGPGITVMDVGSGLGPLLIEAARRGARAIGIELDPEAVEKSMSAASAAGVEIEVRQEDYTQAALDADVVIVNLGAETAKVASRLPRTTVVTVNYDLGRSIVAQREIGANQLITVWGL